MISVPIAYLIDDDHEYFGIGCRGENLVAAMSSKAQIIMKLIRPSKFRERYDKHRLSLGSPLQVLELRTQPKLNPGNASCFVSSLSRLDLNHPPTPVGGIKGLSGERCFCRLDLNYPPTSVGGIRL